MPCSRKLKALTKLFFFITRILRFFFLFLYLLSLFFANLVSFFFRSGDDFLSEEEEYDDEEDEEEEEEEFRYSHVNKNNLLVADIVNNGDCLIFKNTESNETEKRNLRHDHSVSSESLFEDTVEKFDDDNSNPPFYIEDCTTNSDSDNDNDYEVIKEAYTLTSSSSIPLHEAVIPKKDDPEIIELNLKDDIGEIDEGKMEEVKTENNFTREEKFLVFEPPKAESRKLMQTISKEKYEDTYTIGSTSKSSSEWRSSIPDSDDPFSSSSRRSCPKWESYTVYQKYDEEMIFLDRISALKLHETESFRSIQVEPRSISQRIVHKLSTTNNKQKSLEDNYKKSYNELEAAYVAQICLAWEALNWNYVKFKQKRVSSKEKEDEGCPAYIAQQFQQLQVHLQRYIENEPYERGRRPEIYVRKRFATPKLLHVPEYHDYEGENKEEEEAYNAKITSEYFLSILEETIQTFMKFLKSDRKSPCQILTSLFKRCRKGSVDHAIIHLAKKLCNKKKMKLKEIRHSSVLFKKRKVDREEEMEILMGLIDLEVVLRVLRMVDLTKEELQWCENKMNKVRVLDGKLHRDCSPLFFPSNNTLVLD